jgi:predicted transcriptional regulator
MTLVKEVMTHLVVSFRPQEPIEEIARRLLTNRISGAPVVSAGRVVGIVSEADVARATTWADASVHDVMTREVVTIAPDVPVGEAAVLMDRHSVRRLPVVDPDGYLCGVIARADVVRSLAGQWRENEVPAGTL